MKDGKRQLVTIMLLVMVLILAMLYFEAATGSILKNPPPQEFNEDYVVLSVWQIGDNNMGVLLKDRRSSICYEYIGATDDTMMSIRKVDCPI